MNRKYPCMLEMSNGTKYILLEMPRKSCPHLILRLDGELTTAEDMRSVIRFVIMEKFKRADELLNGHSMLAVKNTIKF